MATKWLAIALVPALSNVMYKKYKNMSGGHAGHDSMHLKKNSNHNCAIWKQTLIATMVVTDRTTRTMRVMPCTQYLITARYLVVA